ncbi:MAG: hypothetical protein IJT11_04730 [Bacteroidaceae bacterium]|nr:hypothetical protein [Bacteroidaceae bacterium]
MTNLEFIAMNKDADVQALALGNHPKEIDLHFCLEQITGLQTVQKKVPSIAQKEGILFPRKLSLEQSSSEQTALYKQQLTEQLLPMKRGKMADLTGGFGIDFSFLARLFEQADYVECDERLCEIARHNFPLLGLQHAKIHNTSCEEILDGMGNFDFIYLDPSRRNSAGRKMVALEDCSPNIETMQDKLLSHAPLVMAKLSPMLDIKDAIRRLPELHEVHVVSVDGECKEVLIVLSREGKGISFHCVNLAARMQTFCSDKPNAEPIIASHLEHYLYEPNASILKAGIQNALCRTYNIQKLHPFSHLFISAHFIEDFPGRAFTIEDSYNFSKKDIKRLQTDVSQCNLTVRNFPATVAELRKRLKLREGGDVYLFATTLGDDSHVLLRCKQI